MPDPIDWYESTIDKLSEDKENLQAEVTRLKLKIVQMEMQTADDVKALNEDAAVMARASLALQKLRQENESLRAKIKQMEQR